MVGVCTSTKVPAVGAITTYAQAGVGAIVTQARANPLFGVDGLGLLRKGNRRARDDKTSPAGKMTRSPSAVS